MRFLDIEERRHEVAELLPLIEPQAVDQNEHHATGALQRRHQKFRPDVHGERRAVALRIREPARILLRDEAGEVFAQALLQRPQRLLESRLVRCRQPHFPARQLRDQLDPFAPCERRAAPAFELAEPGDEVAREALLANASTLEQPSDDGEHLAWMDRLHEIIVDLRADGIAQQRVVFALRHHDHGHGRIDGADLGQQIEAAAARHLLVEQHDAVRLPPQHREGVVAVRRLRHRESLLLEKAAVCGEAVHFVVDPENALRTRHRARQASPAGEAGQRATTLAACRVSCACGSAPSATFFSPLPCCAP